jgi:hypothetical protein
MAYVWTSSQQTSIRRLSDGAVLPADPRNADFRAFLSWCDAGNSPQPYSPPLPTAENVRTECQRRITAIVGAPGNLEAAIIKQLNALMRAVILTNNKHSRELTAQELAEEAALTNLANCIQALRARSNALEPNPPADYTNDSYWALP